MGKIAFAWIALACLAACRTNAPELAPPAGPGFRSLSIKFHYRDNESRQNGRVVWRFDEERGKFLFFTPLNQLGLELDVEGEAAVLVNFSKKNFWRGDFCQMLDRLWGIGLALRELKELLVEGVVPQALFAARGIEAVVEPGGKAVRLTRGDGSLALHVQKDEFRPGRIVLVDYPGRYREDELERVLEND